jgi:hypothetical protein
MLKNLYDALLYKHDTTAKLIEIYDALLYKHVFNPEMKNPEIKLYWLSYQRVSLRKQKKLEKKIGRDLQLILVDDTTGTSRRYNYDTTI